MIYVTHKMLSQQAREKNICSWIEDLNISFQMHFLKQKEAEQEGFYSSLSGQFLALKSNFEEPITIVMLLTVLC